MDSHSYREVHRLSRNFIEGQRPTGELLRRERTWDSELELTCVYPSVSFEVRALGVDFFAALVVAHMDPPPLDVRGVGVRRLQVQHRPEGRRRAT